VAGPTSLLIGARSRIRSRCDCREAFQVGTGQITRFTHADLGAYTREFAHKLAGLRVAAQRKIDHFRQVQRVVEWFATRKG